MEKMEKEGLMLEIGCEKHHGRLAQVSFLLN